MTILVIGSEGFIGKNLVQHFANKKEIDSIIGADIKEVSRLKELDYYVKLDPNNSDYEVLFKTHKIDVCINASGMANVGLSFNDPLLDDNLNYVNVGKMLEAIRRYSPDTRFITLSSAAVYGNPENLPIKEESILRPMSPYGYHKMFAEYICQMYTDLYNIKTYILRLFSIYGIGQRKLLLWDLVNKFMKNELVDLYGTGDESRDYIYIDDLLRAIEIIVLNNDINCGIYNVANGEQHTVREVAEMIREILKSEKKIVFSMQSRKGDPANWEADITRLRNIGYIKRVGFREGLEKYVNWAKHQE